MIDMFCGACMPCGLFVTLISSPRAVKMLRHIFVCRPSPSCRATVIEVPVERVVERVVEPSPALCVASKEVVLGELAATGGGDLEYVRC